MTSQSGPFKNIVSPISQNVTTESRYYLGFDSRYRIGNSSIEPTFMYLFGTRNFCAPAAWSGTTAAVPCTSPVGSRRSTDYQCLFWQPASGAHVGALAVPGEVELYPGQQGQRRHQQHRHRQSLECQVLYAIWMRMAARFGRSGSRSLATRRSTARRSIPSSAWVRAGRLDRFGWQIVAGAVEYQLTDNLILEGAAGGFWAAQKPGCPAVLREGSLTGPSCQWPVLTTAT